MLIFNADSESNVTLHYIQQSDWASLFDTSTMPSYLLYSQLFFFLLGKRFLLMASPGVCNVQGASFEGSRLALPLDTLHSDWQCKAHCSKIFECVGWSFVPINNTHGVCQLFDKIYNIRKEEQVSASGYEPCPNGSRCQCQGLSLGGKPCNVLNSVDAVAGWRNCQEIMGRFSMDGCKFFSFHGSRCELYQEIGQYFHTIKKGAVSGSLECGDQDWCTELTTQIYSDVLGIGKATHLTTLAESTESFIEIESQEHFEIEWNNFSDTKKPFLLFNWETLTVENITDPVRIKELLMETAINATESIMVEWPTSLPEINHNNTIGNLSSSIAPPVVDKVLSLPEDDVPLVASSATILQPLVFFKRNMTRTCLPHAASLSLLKPMLAILVHGFALLSICYVFLLIGHGRGIWWAIALYMMINLASTAHGVSLNVYDINNESGAKTDIEHLSLSANFIKTCETSSENYRFVKNVAVQVFVDGYSRLVDMRTCFLKLSTSFRYCQSNFATSILFPSIPAMEQHLVEFSEEDCKSAFITKTLSFTAHGKKVNLRNLKQVPSVRKLTLQGQQFKNGACVGGAVHFRNTFYPSTVILAEVEVYISSTRQVYDYTTQQIIYDDVLSVPADTSPVHDSHFGTLIFDIDAIPRDSCEKMTSVFDGIASLRQLSPDDVNNAVLIAKSASLGQALTVILKTPTVSKCGHRFYKTNIDQIVVFLRENEQDVVSHRLMDNSKGSMTSTLESLKIELSALVSTSLLTTLQSVESNFIELTRSVCELRRADIALFLRSMAALPDSMGNDLIEGMSIKKLGGSIILFRGIKVKAKLRHISPNEDCTTYIPILVTDESGIEKNLWATPVGKIIVNTSLPILCSETSIVPSTFWVASNNNTVPVTNSSIIDIITQKNLKSGEGRYFCITERRVAPCAEPPVELEPTQVASTSVLKSFSDLGSITFLGEQELKAIYTTINGGLLRVVDSSYQSLRRFGLGITKENPFVTSLNPSDVTYLTTQMLPHTAVWGLFYDSLSNLLIIGFLISLVVNFVAFFLRVRTVYVARKFSIKLLYTISADIFGAVVPFRLSSLDRDTLENVRDYDSCRFNSLDRELQDLRLHLNNSSVTRDEYEHLANRIEGACNVLHALALQSQAVGCALRGIGRPVSQFQVHLNNRSHDLCTASSILTGLAGSHAIQFAGPGGVNGEAPPQYFELNQLNDVESD